MCVCQAHINMFVCKQIYTLYIQVCVIHIYYIHTVDINVFRAGIHTQQHIIVMCVCTHNKYICILVYILVYNTHVRAIVACCYILCLDDFPWPEDLQRHSSERIQRVVTHVCILCAHTFLYNTLVCGCVCSYVSLCLCKFAGM